MTLLERLPEERQKATSIQFARYWINFGYGNAPWPAFSLDHQNQNADQIIAVADSRDGWVVRSREEDTKCSSEAEGGVRRYMQWELLEGILSQLGDDAKVVVDKMSFPNLMKLSNLEPNTLE
ncbi:hypothetical protein H2198_003872 [Neophaeococcomyces mojaviensis]|uniref:Uncharacterized protein n=1 Tax=Neophaeococcomyces mojaviensis TaxID=3383035 RepID=A0ACC3AAJ3_9EURO|nr:hypothetical protein H2198_003872 [Knufia sp. JES_112]